MRPWNGETHELQATLWYLASNPIPAWLPAGLNRRLWRVDLRLQKLLTMTSPMAARLLLNADGFKNSGGKIKRSTLKLLWVITLWGTVLVTSPTPTPTTSPITPLPMFSWAERASNASLESQWSWASDKCVVSHWLLRLHPAVITHLMKRRKPTSNLDLHIYNAFLFPFSKSVFLKGAILFLNNNSSSILLSSC